MKKTGIGLIGADFSLRAALIEYNYPREKAEMAAVCDRNPAMLELYRREHPDTKAHLYATYQELIADPDVDAVCVMVRDQYHEEIAVALRGEKRFIWKSRWRFPSKAATGFWNLPSGRAPSCLSGIICAMCRPSSR